MLLVFKMYDLNPHECEKPPHCDSSHLVQEVVIGGPVLLVEMSQDAVVPAGLAEVERSQCVHRRLSLLGRVGGAIGGSLEEKEREGV